MNALHLWAILGVILMIAEIFVPGFSLFWIGCAALITAAALMLSPSLDGLAAQLIVFILSAVGMISVGYLLRNLWFTASEGDAGLNRKADRKIGRVYVLETAIVNGTGRARVGDSSWSVRGPDMQAGQAVIVVETDGAVLVVKAHERT